MYKPQWRSSLIIWTILGLVAGCVVIVWSFDFNLALHDIPPQPRFHKNELVAAPLFSQIPETEKITLIPQAAVSAVDYSNSKYYDFSILRYLVEHPEFGVTDSQAEKIQAMYSKLCRMREDFEAEHAKVVRISEHETSVEIPVYNDLATTWLADFQECIDETLPDSPHQSKISHSLLSKFVADNDGLGQVPSYLHLTRLSGSTSADARFSLRREKVTVPSTTLNPVSFRHVYYTVEVTQRDLSRISVPSRFLP